MPRLCECTICLCQSPVVAEDIRAKLCMSSEVDDHGTLIPDHMPPGVVGNICGVGPSGISERDRKTILKHFWLLAKEADPQLEVA